MTMALPRVAVVGAGVSGLTTALLLAECRYSVRVLAEEYPATTSCAAGAIWGPYLSAHPDADRWGHEGLAAFTRLAAEFPDAGVCMVAGIEASRSYEDVPVWAADVPDFQRLTADQLPGDFVTGWHCRSPIIEMRKYLDFLAGELRRWGVEVEGRHVESLAEAAAATGADVVVNCAGLGARELADDHDLNPIRGELVVVKNPGINEFFADHTEGVPEMTYWLPQGKVLVLGGSAEPGRTDVDPDVKVTDAILARCAAIEPALANADVLDHRVGLRPARERIRLEHVAPARLSQPHLVHNYGHGGGGVTLSWGCANEVRELIRAI
jgi:D-amino-acid oxidase